MKVQLLIAALNKNPVELLNEMNIDSDAVLVNQCNEEKEETIFIKGHSVLVLCKNERGVGKSRNLAISRATGDIVVFSDDDIRYVDGYAEKIVAEFEGNKDAEMIVFNVEIAESRKTFENTDRKRVHWYNCGRYGAVSFAIRLDCLKKYGVTYSLLFGGGAKYANGEDSLFILELLKKGCKVYTSPVTIGKEVEGDSSWFNGYNEKYFFDRGVLYRCMYGAFAPLMALRFLFAHRQKMCETINIKQAYKLMKAGIKEGKEIS